MNYFAIGVNHTTAPLAVRERLAIAETQLAEAVRRLAHWQGVEEALILSTCNRVELIGCSSTEEWDATGFLAEFFGLSRGECERYFYRHRGEDAVRHLFRVAASLDSLVVGEAQILGQLKSASAVAREAGCVHGALEQLLSRAYAVAKRVRCETSVAATPVSIASVAVDLAGKIFGTLRGKTVYLVGAGRMSELAARHFRSAGVERFLVSNRSLTRAKELAASLGGEAVAFEYLFDSVPRADIVLSSTSAPHLIFQRSQGEKLLAQRRNKPMFFIDIAVPRDVDPALNDLDGIFVYDVDDLQQVAEENLGGRRREAEQAEGIVEEEVARFAARLQDSNVAPLIVALQEHLEDLRQGELARQHARLASLTPEQAEAVEALTHGLVNKILHSPMIALKAAARQGEAETAEENVRQLFGLMETAEEGGEAESAGRGCPIPAQRKAEH
jgi:glutamyl-tRNA reductase